MSEYIVWEVKGRQLVNPSDEMTNWYKDAISKRILKARGELQAERGIPMETVDNLREADYAAQAKGSGNSLHYVKLRESSRGPQTQSITEELL